MIVRERVLLMVEAVRDNDFFSWKIDGFHIAEQEVDAFEHLPKWVHNRRKALDRWLPLRAA